MEDPEGVEIGEAVEELVVDAQPVFDVEGAVAVLHKILQGAEGKKVEEQQAQVLVFTGHASAVIGNQVGMIASGKDLQNFELAAEFFFLVLCTFADDLDSEGSSREGRPVDSSKATTTEDLIHVERSNIEIQR
ncbi:hypothetical protein QR680_014890 [Steinernema hermaphroditum]|uniref:Uncharacterized protein n=1 Tax=Steinernema hermaphroditum TaxID=289476 RepID=A0AA39IAE5_9BILA|nr:hypothetical protein QR680_014890 [Steinernema hermaphroditum]